VTGADHEDIELGLQKCHNRNVRWLTP
jgi:hypothetical protein